MLIWFYVYSFLFKPDFEMKINLMDEQCVSEYYFSQNFMHAAVWRKGKTKCAAEEQAAGMKGGKMSG